MIEYLLISLAAVALFVFVLIALSMATAVLGILVCSLGRETVKQKDLSDGME